MIDVDATTKLFEKYKPRIAGKRIKMVEVVRCKECKYRGIIDYPVCCETPDEWFCSRGKRRE